MSVERPPEIEGIEWESTICPACGCTWWVGRDVGNVFDNDFDVSAEEWTARVGVCPDCREAHRPRPNRAQRRARRGSHS